MSLEQLDDRSWMDEEGDVRSIFDSEPPEDYDDYAAPVDVDYDPVLEWPVRQIPGASQAAERILALAVDKPDTVSPEVVEPKRVLSAEEVKDAARYGTKYHELKDIIQRDYFIHPTKRTGPSLPAKSIGEFFALDVFRCLKKPDSEGDGVQLTREGYKALCEEFSRASYGELPKTDTQPQSDVFNETKPPVTASTRIPDRRHQARDWASAAAGDWDDPDDE